MFTKPTDPYPLATKDGQYIPHEVALPMGLLRMEVAASTTAATTELPANAAFLAVEASSDCYLDFRVTPITITSGAYAPGVFYVPANVAFAISVAAIPNAAYERLTVVAGGNNVVLYLTPMAAWGNLGETIQGGTL